MGKPNDMRTIKDRGRAKPVLTKAGFTRTRRRLECGGKKRD